MQRARVDVGICLDENMVEAAAVLLASIKAHARVERPVRVHVVSVSASAAFQALADVMNDERFEIVAVACSNPHDGRPMRDYLTAAIFLRFQFPTLLSDLERLIYLDVDIVVDRDLEALFDTDLGGRPLAAVPDWPMLVGSTTWPSFRIPYQGRRLTFAAYAREILGLDCATGAPYFNTGVLVMDLAAWRRDDLAAKTLALLDGRPGLYYPDQDALNAILKGDFVPLDARWNAHATCMRRTIPAPWDFTRAGRRWGAIRALWRRDPWIVHYAGANKPWVPGHAATPRDGLWWRYAALSPLGARIRETYRASEGKGRRRRVPRDGAADEKATSSPLA